MREMPTSGKTRMLKNSVTTSTRWQFVIYFPFLVVETQYMAQYSITYAVIIHIHVLITCK